METARNSPVPLPQLTLGDLAAMLEWGEISVCRWERRHTLLAICALAARSRTHTALSRWRLKAFRARLEAMEGNDEVEVTGEFMWEVLVYAENGLRQR